MLVYYKVEIIIISSNIICSRHDIAEKIGNLALNNNYSLTSFINLKPNYGTEMNPDPKKNYIHQALKLLLQKVEKLVKSGISNWRF